MNAKRSSIVVLSVQITITNIQRNCVGLVLILVSKRVVIVDSVQGLW